MFEIELANGAGFCAGVRRAVELARPAARGRTATLGPLVHNEQVVSQLEREGIGVIQSLDELVSGDTVIVRAHGVAPDIYRIAGERGISVIDATCPLVSRLQHRCRELAGDGHRVCVIGDPTHPEVQAALAWAGGDAVAVESPNDGAAVTGQIAVVCQTTMSPEVIDRILARLESSNEVVIVDRTTCPATVDRQRATRTLAKRVDVMLVAGNEHSANTRQLVRVAEGTGVRTHLVPSADNIDPTWFKGATRVGVTAGASTPDRTIKEVLSKMEDIRQQGEFQPEEERQDEDQKAPDQATGCCPECECDGTGTEAPAEEEGTCGCACEAECGTDAEADAEAEAEAEAADQDAGTVEPSTEDMEVRQLRPGDVVRGTVAAVGQDNVLVDVGHKSEGVIPLWELSQHHVESPSDVVNVGDEIDVYVLAVEGDEGVLRLSKKRAEEEVSWERLEAAHESGEVVEAPVTEEVKGGLIVDVGARGFMPASHVERGYVSDLGQYVGKNVRVRVIELERQKNRVIVSQKVVVEEEYARLREETWANIKEGDRRRGVVKSITDFGAFVDIGGVDGLLHVSEMSWGRVNHPSEVVREGDEIDVAVLRLDREKEKISLGLKQALPDPWDNVEREYPVDSFVTGKVVRTVGFGAFVQLQPGVEGLVHISQLANRRVASPDEVVSVGDEIRAKVLRVSGKDRRISLSMREAEQERERSAMREYMSEGASDNVTLGDMFGDILNRSKDQIAREGNDPDES